MYVKFIFFVKLFEIIDECKSVWVYLGLGNLIGLGFIKKVLKFGGNIEVGVVFEVKGIIWVGEENLEMVLSLKLFFCFDSDYVLIDIL